MESGSAAAESGIVMWATGLNPSNLRTPPSRAFEPGHLDPKSVLSRIRGVRDEPIVVRIGRYLPQVFPVVEDLGGRGPRPRRKMDALTNTGLRPSDFTSRREIEFAHGVEGDPRRRHAMDAHRPRGPSARQFDAIDREFVHRFGKIEDDPTTEREPQLAVARETLAQGGKLRAHRQTPDAKQPRERHDPREPTKASNISENRNGHAKRPRAASASSVWETRACREESPGRA
jgi:hypothetical protein